MEKSLLDRLKERAYRAFAPFKKKEIVPVFEPGVDIQLTKNFRLSEFVKSDTAIRHDLDNWPKDAETVDNIKDLCIGVLQPVRDMMGKPIRINSGFRSPELNKLIKGADKSQHMKGQAADIEIVGLPNKKLAEFIKKHIPEYDQLILEYWYEEDANSGWVHVSLKRDNNRKQELTINKNGVFLGFKSQ